MWGVAVHKRSLHIT